MSPDNGDFEQRMKSDLRRIVTDTSPELRARISAMAAEAAREKPRWTSRLRPALLPIGAVAALAAIVVAVPLLKRPADMPGQPPAISADDVALLLNIDNLDLLEQMEFYQWLDRQPGVLDAAGAAAPESPQRS